jgi:hypothetical protein
MSDEVIALIITIAIIALFFVWVPLLDFICPPCGRFLARWRLPKEKAEPERRPYACLLTSTLKSQTNGEKGLD